MAPKSWPWPAKWNGYRSVRASDSTDPSEKLEAERGLLSDSGSESSTSPRSTSLDANEHIAPRFRHQASRWSTAIIVVNVLLFLSSVALFIGLPYRQPNGLNHDLKRVSFWSPILDQVEIPLVDTQVDGDLFPGEHQNLGRREPSPETDAIWEDYELQLPFGLTRDEVLKLGKDPEKVVKLPDELFGLGDDMYMGGLDVFHVLHCFDAIRMEAFKDYYFDGEEYHMEAYGEHFKPPRRTHTELYWVHLRHCSDIIVQNLMCNADGAMLTWTWMETQDLPFPDFSVNRKCRDWDTIAKWRNEKALDSNKIGQIRKTHDQTKISDGYWKLYGNETTVGDNRHHPVWD